MHKSTLGRAINAVTDHIALRFDILPHGSAQNPEGNLIKDIVLLKSVPAKLPGEILFRF
jgi:hypothetical protein